MISGQTPHWNFKNREASFFFMNLNDPTNSTPN
jgi:hypothetical protein